MINAPLYETLPYAYIGAGLLNAALLDSPLKYLPVFMLVGAGLLVLAWRANARAAARKTRPAARRSSALHRSR